MTKQYCPDHGLKASFGCCSNEREALSEFSDICRSPFLIDNPNILLAQPEPKIVFESIFPKLKKPYWKLELYTASPCFLGLKGEIVYVPGDYYKITSSNTGRSFIKYFPEARQFLGPPGCNNVSISDPDLYAEYDTMKHTRWSLDDCEKLIDDYIHKPINCRCRDCCY